MTGVEDALTAAVWPSAERMGEDVVKLKHAITLANVYVDSARAEQRLLAKPLRNAVVDFLVMLKSIEFTAAQKKALALPLIEDLTKAVREYNLATMEKSPVETDPARPGICGSCGDHTKIFWCQEEQRWLCDICQRKSIDRDDEHDGGRRT